MTDFICTQCQHPFETNRKLKLHERVHDQRDFTCKACDKVIKGLLNFNAHKSSHKSYSCENCYLFVPLTS